MVWETREILLLLLLLLLRWKPAHVGYDIWSIISTNILKLTIVYRSLLLEKIGTRSHFSTNPGLFNVIHPSAFGCRGPFSGHIKRSDGVLCRLKVALKSLFLIIENWNIVSGIWYVCHKIIDHMSYPDVQVFTLLLLLILLLYYYSTTITITCY